MLDEWLAERDAWLRRHGIDPAAADWQMRWTSWMQKACSNSGCSSRIAGTSIWTLATARCVLRRPELAEVVARSLQHFDGERYELTDFVVMPNHVHLLVAFPDEESMLEQCESWKRYTADEDQPGAGPQRAILAAGRVRSPGALGGAVRALRQYIADNPRRSGLGKGEYIHFSKPSVSSVAITLRVMESVVITLRVMISSRGA